MATNFGCTISLAIQGEYAKGASFCEVVQVLRWQHENSLRQGVGIHQASVAFAIQTINIGTLQTYDLAPMVDVFGNANTWRQLRTIIVKNWDATAAINRWLQVAGSSQVIYMGGSTGTQFMRCLPEALFAWDCPGFQAQFNISNGNRDIVTLIANGASAESPILYDLWLLGTK